MDYKQVFFGILVAFIITSSLSAFAVMMNNKYSSSGAETIDTGFMETGGFNDIPAYVGSVSSDVANSTSPPSVSSGGELTQSKNTFSLIRSMVDFVPKLFWTGGSILGIPETYIKVGIWAFVFAFGITLAYLLILGVQRLL